MTITTIRRPRSSLFPPAVPYNALLPALDDDNTDGIWDTVGRTDRVGDSGVGPGVDTGTGEDNGVSDEGTGAIGTVAASEVDDGTAGNDVVGVGNVGTAAF